MHVEIDDRDLPQPVRRPRMHRADGDVVEQAESHAASGLGVMAGRADRAEGVAGVSGRHLVDGVDDRACGAQRRFARPRGNDGVRIHPRASGGGHFVEAAPDVTALVNAGEIVERSPARFLAFEARVGIAGQRRVDGLDSRRSFRMPDAGVVIERTWMRVDESGHSAASPFIAWFRGILT